MNGGETFPLAIDHDTVIIRKSFSTYEINSLCFNFLLTLVDHCHNYRYNYLFTRPTKENYENWSLLLMIAKIVT